MRQKDLKLLENTPCFTKSALRQLHNTKPSSLDKDIQNWIKKGILIPLKRGLYTTEKFLLKERNPELFIEYISNKLVIPSYISCDYVLQKHSLLTDAILSITSVSIKTTRSFQNKLGSFKFYTLSKQLFSGFEAKPYGNNSILIATKAKALFDYLYLNQHLFQNFTKNEALELRINFDELNRKDWHEFEAYSKKCKINKMINIFNCLKKYSD